MKSSQYLPILTTRLCTSFICGHSKVFATSFRKRKIASTNFLLDAVHAGSGVIMCSYNRINNSYGSANSKNLNGLLKTELGFQGFVVSDWDAQHSGVASALAGLECVSPLYPHSIVPSLT